MMPINDQAAPKIVEVDRDLMIDDLSYQDAHEYVLKFFTAEKRTAQMLKIKQQDFQTWNERLVFAERQADAALLEKTKQHLHRLIQERDTLKTEYDDLHRKNIILKEKLDLKAKAANLPSTARAEQLLADFEQLVDVDEYKLKQAMQEQEADDELAKLKAKLMNQ